MFSSLKALLSVSAKSWIGGRGSFASLHSLLRSHLVLHWSLFTSYGGAKVRGTMPGAATLMATPDGAADNDGDQAPPATRGRPAGSVQSANGPLIACIMHDPFPVKSMWIWTSHGTSICISSKLDCWHFLPEITKS